MHCIGRPDPAHGSGQQLTPSPFSLHEFGTGPLAISGAGDASHLQTWPPYLLNRLTSCWLGATGQPLGPVLVAPGHTEP